MPPALRRAGGTPEHEKFGYEPARLTAGERALVDDEDKASEFTANVDQVWETPEAIEKIVFEAPVEPDRERHAFGHVVEIELDQVGDGEALIIAGGCSGYLGHELTVPASLVRSKMASVNKC